MPLLAGDSDRSSLSPEIPHVPRQVRAPEIPERRGESPPFRAFPRCSSDAARIRPRRLGLESPRPGDGRVRVGALHPRTSAPTALPRSSSNATWSRPRRRDALRAGPRRPTPAAAAAAVVAAVAAAAAREALEDGRQLPGLRPFVLRISAINNNRNSNNVKNAAEGGGSECERERE